MEVYYEGNMQYQVYRLRDAGTCPLCNKISREKKKAPDNIPRAFSRPHNELIVLFAVLPVSALYEKDSFSLANLFRRVSRG